MLATSKTGAALLVAATLALSACGGDSDSDSGSATTPTTTAPAATAPAAETLTRADFVAQAEAICTATNAKLRRLGQPPDTAAFVAIGTRAVAITGAARDQLSQLTPPSELQLDYDRLLDLLGTQTAITVRMVRAAQAGDDATIGTLNGEVTTANQRSDAVASRLGLDACATE